VRDQRAKAAEAEKEGVIRALLEATLEMQKKEQLHELAMHSPRPDVEQVCTIPKCQYAADNMVGFM
jgi:hypothetical protein